MPTSMSRYFRLAAAILVAMPCATSAAAQLSPERQDILRRIHTTQELGAGGRGAGSSSR